MTTFGGYLWYRVADASGWKWAKATDDARRGVALFMASGISAYHDETARDSLRGISAFGV